MVWRRGLLVCREQDVEAVEAVLAAEVLSCTLTSRGGEVAFAFASEMTPDLEGFVMDGVPPDAGLWRELRRA